MKTSFITSALHKKNELNQYRVLREFSENNFVNFSSNNYLGLATHPLLKERAIAFTNQFGTGAGASRLVFGHHGYHTAVEAKIAKLIGSEAAILFNSGYQANATILHALADKNSMIFADKQIHNSLLVGANNSQAKLIRFKHQDLNHLAELLELHDASKRRIIVTESIFSMDGSITDLPNVIHLADKYDTLLYIDDAHATGIIGHNGMGAIANQRGIDIALGAFGKAAGAFGAFVACTFEMKEFLVNFCPGFIYTTALPPPIIGAIDASLDLIPAMHAERNTLFNNVEEIKSFLKPLGYHTESHSSPIIPVMLGDEKLAMSLSKWLEQKKILAYPIRPPTVPAGTSRIRLTVSAMHTKSQLMMLKDAIEQWQC